MVSTTKQIIEIETLQAGQPKPYADSIYEYLITLNWCPDDPDGYIKGLAKTTLDLHGLRGSSAEGDWWLPYIEEIKRTSEHTWKVRIKRDFLD